MSSPNVTYLTLDPVGEGVGTSQVGRYVSAIARRGVEIKLHSFEREAPLPELADQLRASGVQWKVHPFGAAGSKGGVARLARAAFAVRDAHLVHARSDLAAAAASTRSRSWIWDMRAFFAEQRIALGTLQANSLEHRALRFIERRAATSASSIVTLTRAAVPVLTERFGPEVTAKCEVITTCVDLDRFTPTDAPTGDLTFLLSGTLNSYYDVPTMLRVVAACRERRSSRLVVASPLAGPWESALYVADHRLTLSPAEMPDLVSSSHVGLSVCRFDAGMSLRAAMPTKLGEFLATGRPVVVNRGLGDMDRIIDEFRCGVILDKGDDSSVRNAADEIIDLIDDPSTAERCRAAAVAHFNLDRAVDRLVELYASLT
jgi:glycosyltransferase involved in cell wall biosynthesis